MNIRPTQVMRNVMRAHGRDIVYTNNYPNCHTVKCYQVSPNADDKLINEVYHVASMTGIKGITVKKCNSKNSYYGWRSIIVRIPK